MTMLDPVKLLERDLAVQDLKLNSLLEMTNAINQQASIEHLTKIYAFSLRDQLGFDKFLLFNKQKEWELLLKFGVKAKTKDFDVQNDLARFREITVIESSQSTVLNEFDVIVPIWNNNEPLAYLLLAGLEHEKLRLKETMTNISFIQTLTNIMVVAIQNNHFALDKIKKAKMKKELELAAEMQKMLLPSSLPSNAKMDISAKYIQRHEVGGDYYDYIPINDEEFIICIADVSGKGITAALLMANFQASVRALVKYKELNLEKLVRELNELVYKNAQGERFITFFIAHYHAGKRSLSYINAGHNQPFLTNRKELTYLDKGTVGLGMFDELPFIEKEEVYIPNNTTLILYTDGVVELENQKGEFFEIDRLVKVVHNFYPLSMFDINNIILGKLDDWRGVRKFVDDTAVLACRFF